MHYLNIGNLDFECGDFDINFFDRARQISSKYQLFRNIGILNISSVFAINYSEKVGAVGRLRKIWYFQIFDVWITKIPL